MPALHPDVDPDGLLEFSVVYTDRALNHMSSTFQAVMTDIGSMLKRAYHARSAILVPGGGTFGMEAVARQFGKNEKCLIIRNGWFSYRWTEILESGSIASSTTVLKARRIKNHPSAPFIPVPIDEAVATIEQEKPAVVFAPHVETSAGMMLPDSYLEKLSEAAHSVDALFVLDCIASGTLWVDMESLGIDVLISAPQKGWSGPPCAGLVMLGERARQKIENTQSDSYSCDLKKWLGIMEAYEAGGHAYHSTMPTESLRQFRDVMRETENFGFDRARDAQVTLGKRVRALLESRDLISVAAPGFHAPGVIVSYTDDQAVQNGSLFAAHGVQIAAGVPLMCDEGDSFKTFRLGLFGLDKLQNINSTVSSLEAVLDEVFAVAEA